jgi:predicted  nucleic acid-binding Zn-ribbon protein
MADEDHKHNRRASDILHMPRWIISLLMPLIISVVIGYGTYRVLQYRLDAAEEKIKTLENKVETGNTNFININKDKELLTQALNLFSNEVKGSLNDIKTDIREIKQKQDKMNEQMLMHNKISNQ